ncbi:ribosome maturation protein SDO1 [Nematocida ausubeli]|nr:ribosome maturation protein SDO1 [Nematocida ausubeli]KAI5160702.1 ribosome maturation protein SDO1 [Nematocida ausubeli]KAI5161871.1 ribosome maturation protein SDO1 [Nematocida ausubeli]
MIFTPENIKKLQDIVVVVYKGKHGNYEVAAHPKKLYEYRRQTASLDEVLWTESIFSDISKGKLAGKKSVQDEFGRDHGKALEEILKLGTERKDSATREYEQENSKKAMAEGIIHRMRKEGGEVLTHAEAEGVLRKINYTPSGKPMKIQLSDVLKKTVLLGYARRKIRARVAKRLDWSAITSALPIGSFLREIDATGIIEMSDDLYGAVHRHAESHNAEIEDLPDIEDAEVEI